MLAVELIHWQRLQRMVKLQPSFHFMRLVEVLEVSQIILLMDPIKEEPAHLVADLLGQQMVLLVQLEFPDLDLEVEAPTIPEQL